MSFTMVVKDEASKIETTRLEDISELSAIIRIAGNINNNINVTIENNAVARRVFKLFKEIYGISPSITVRNKKLGRGLTYILNINNKKFEVINENKFVSTSNGNKFEMTFSDKDVNIKNLQDGKISKIDFKNLIDGNKNDAIELIKKLSGEELLALKENVNKLKVEKYVITGGCYECETKNVLSNNNFDTLLHELGHAKDHTLKNEKNNIRNGKISYGNKNVVKSFEEEKKLFIKNFPQTQRKQIWYFLSDGLNEIVAESNMLINYHANGNSISARARVLRQYFPKTIALIAQELNK